MVDAMEQVLCYMSMVEYTKGIGVTILKKEKGIKNSVMVLFTRETI